MLELETFALTSFFPPSPIAENKAHLQDILQSVTHYINTDSLAPDQRFGFIVLNKLAGLWVEQYRPATAPPVANGAPPSPVPGFEQFLYSNAVKLCFEVPLKPSFDYSDAQSFQVSPRAYFSLGARADRLSFSLQVIGEIANLLKALLQKRGAEFVEFMTSTLLPSIQCPPDAAQAFMTALQEAPECVGLYLLCAKRLADHLFLPYNSGKQFKKFLQEWLRQSRGAPR